MGYPFYESFKYYNPYGVDPNQPVDLSPWTKETLDAVIRVSMGCFAGSSIET